MRHAMDDLVNALLTRKERAIITALRCGEAEVYPVSPRLLSVGEGYICDRCERRWGVGSISGCAPCAEACKNLARDRRGKEANE